MSAECATKRAPCAIMDVMNFAEHTPVGRVLPRKVEGRVTEALQDTRVVLVKGARQGGKSTLVRQVGTYEGAVWRSLDDPDVREAAMYDPRDFVTADKTLIIDEVQRVPDLFLAIKATVDEDPRPGRFLLTGSARLLGMRSIPDLLPGRVETVELWPLSQGEIDGAPDGFVDALFAHGPQVHHESEETKDGYLERVVRGGFPEAVVRESRRRGRFLDDYVADLINRDVIQISEIQRGPEMRALVRMLAARPGQLLVPGALAGELGLPKSTVDRYIALLEEVFLIKRVAAWSRNISARAVRTPKLAFVDTGVAANLIDVDERGLRRHDTELGGFVENFVAMEIARQLEWSDVRVEMFHYRTKDKVEVDVVLENRWGQVVAVEVKSSSTARAEDFSGIKHLHERIGDDLIAGVVLYTGKQTLSFGPKYKVLPLSALWELAV